jgi:hypothetical protein
MISTYYLWACSTPGDLGTSGCGCSFLRDCPIELDINVALPPKLIWVDKLRHRLTVHAIVLHDSTVYQKVALVYLYMHSLRCERLGTYIQERRRAKEKV